MTAEAYVQGFGCLPDPTPYSKARAVVLPVSLEWGGGEGPGVGLGPMAVLGASRFVETYESELAFDPLDRGVATIDGPTLTYGSAEEPFEQIQDHAAAILRDGKIPVALGGERTIVVPLVRAAKALTGDVGVVLLPRRPGLLDRAQGRQLAPATIGRRLAELGRTVIIGPRFWTADEGEAMGRDGAPLVVPAWAIRRRDYPDPDWFGDLPSKVHLSVDVGVLDPATLPMAGNVEPGGLDWFQLVDLIDAVFRERQVVSIDISGYAPPLGHVAPSVVVAQLVLRCLGRALA